MKKIFLGIILMIILMIVFGIYVLVKDNPDFAPYTRKEYDIAYDINSDIYNLSEIKREITNIAEKYEKGIKLTCITYYLENKDNGTIEFKLFKSDCNGKNKACSIIIKMNVATKKTTDIIYEKGHGKRISGYSDEINNRLDENILSNYINNNDENIIITVTNFQIKKIYQKLEGSRMNPLKL